MSQRRILTLSASLVVVMALLVVPAMAAQGPQVPETIEGAAPPITAGPFGPPKPLTDGGLLYLTSLDYYDPTFAVYDPATNAWTTLTPYETGAQMAVSSAGQLYAYGYNTGTIDLYDPATDTWSPVTSAPPGATGQYGNLEITNAGEFLYTEPWGSTLWYTDGGVWNTMSLPFSCDAMGDYDTTTNQYVIGEAWTTNAHWIDLDTWAITDYYSGVGNGEYSRFSSVLDNRYYFEAGGSSIHYFDLSNPAAPPVDTGVTASWYGSSAADRANHLIYIADLEADPLWVYDPATNSLTELPAGPYGWHTSLAFTGVGEAPDTMHVGGIEGAISLDPFGRPVLRARVLAEDETAMPLGDVLVEATITVPGGEATRTRYTKPAGWARFHWGDNPGIGTWTLCVNNLTLAGYTYNPGDNVVTCMDWVVP